MSVEDKILRLAAAKEDIISALSDKEVDAAEHGFEDFAKDISSIEVEDPSYTINIPIQDALGMINDFILQLNLTNAEQQEFNQRLNFIFLKD